MNGETIKGQTMSTETPYDKLGDFDLPHTTFCTSFGAIPTNVPCYPPFSTPLVRGTRIAFQDSDRSAPEISTRNLSHGERNVAPTRSEEGPKVIGISCIGAVLVQDFDVILKTDCSLFTPLFCLTVTERPKSIEHADHLAGYAHGDTVQGRNTETSA